jgi:hypothetical protein
VADDPRLLEDLLTEGRADEVLSMVSLRETAEAWCRYHTRPHTDGEEFDPDWWAVDLLRGSNFADDTARFREAILLTVEVAPSDEVLAVIGATFLEVVVWGGEDWLQWIERAASESARFRTALANVWIEELGPDAFLRIQAAAQTELPWHDAHGRRPRAS